MTGRKQEEEEGNWGGEEESEVALKLGKGGRWKKKAEGREESGEGREDVKGIKRSKE